MARERAHPLATGDRLQSVTRALAVLDLLITQPDGMTAKAIARTFEIGVPTIYHLLNSLAATGYIARDPDTRLFALGPRIPHLSQGYMRRGLPTPASAASLRALAQTTGEFAGLFRLIGDDAVCVMLEPGSKPTALRGGYVGFSTPAHHTAAGRVLLAALPAARVRRYLDGPYGAGAAAMYGDAAGFRSVLRRASIDGYAIDLNDSHPEICCIAAPIGEATAGVAEALSLVVTPEVYLQQNAILLSAVRAAARTAAEAVVTPPRAHALPDAELGPAALRSFGFPD